MRFLFGPCAWIFLPVVLKILKYLMKSLETFHKWPIQYSLLKKLSLELAPIMLVLFQSLQDFTYIAFKGLVCIVFTQKVIISHSFFESLSYRIEIIWNFSHTAEWWGFNDKTKFGPLLIHCRDLSTVDL